MSTTDMHRVGIFYLNGVLSHNKFLGGKLLNKTLIACLLRKKLSPRPSTCRAERKSKGKFGFNPMLRINMPVKKCDAHYVG